MPFDGRGPWMIGPMPKGNQPTFDWLDSGASPQFEPMPAWAWAVVLGSFCFLVALLNLLLPYPDIQDFGGLGRLCLLIERRGLEFCFNRNWGFAHPLANYLLTRATGDLLVSQRLLAAAGAVVAILAADLLMRRLLELRDYRLRVAFLLGMIFSPWMVESLVSVHLDIIPIALVLAALGLLARGDCRGYLFGGLLAGMGYWFRFHYLGYSLLYVLLIPVLRGRRAGKREVAAAVGGVGISVVGPSLICLAFHGVPVPSNQKAVLAGLTHSYSRTLEYQRAIDELGFGQIVADIDWIGVGLCRAAAVSDRAPLVLLLLVFAVHLWLEWKGAARCDGDSGGAVVWRRAMRVVSHRPAALLCCVFAATLPFVLLRGLPFRLESAVFLIAFPVVAAIFSRRRLYEAGLILAFGLVSVSETPHALYDQFDRAKKCGRLARQIEGALPSEVARDHPTAVLSAKIDCHNRRDRYWLWNPAITGGWPARSEWLVDEFGLVAVDELPSGLPEEVRNVILARPPQYEVERWDPALVKAADRVTPLDDAVVVELTPNRGSRGRAAKKR